MNKPGVFLSHNWQDKEFVRKLATDLQHLGARVWLDEAEIQIGDSLIEKIRSGIDEMDYLAVILSPHSVNSEWVKKEVDIAMNQEIENKKVKVLPIKAAACEMPGFLKGKLYADFTTQEKYPSALSQVAKKLGLATKGHPKEGRIFDNALFHECRERLGSDKDKQMAVQKYGQSNARDLGDWFLDKLKPGNESFWVSIQCDRETFLLLARIIKEMGELTPRAMAIRDKIVEQTNDSFGYDWEYNDWIRNRERTIYDSLITIGDDVCLSAVNKRWPKGLDPYL
jgi:hypothetical protein